jgi:hypothetical protein
MARISLVTFLAALVLAVLFVLSPAEAAKGPIITHKVCTLYPSHLSLLPPFFRYLHFLVCNLISRCTLKLNMVASPWAG